MGFPKYGDEYKVMGMAAYGEPTLVDKVRQLVPAAADGKFQLDLRYFRHLREGVEMTWANGEPELGVIYTEELERLFGKPTRKRDDELDQFHKDLASSAQRVYEERFFALVRELQKRTGMKKLTLAGGCALNSLANGRLFEHTDIQDVYIQAGAGDGGTSLGAALYAQHAILGCPREFVMEHAYWGPQYEEADIRAAVAKGIPGSEGRDGAHGELIVESFADDDRILEETAASIGRGEVIGWYQGAASGARGHWGTGRSWPTSAGATCATS